MRFGNAWKIWWTESYWKPPHVLIIRETYVTCQYSLSGCEAFPIQSVEYSSPQRVKGHCGGLQVRTSWKETNCKPPNVLIIREAYVTYQNSLPGGEDLPMHEKIDENVKKRMKPLTTAPAGTSCWRRVFLTKELRRWWRAPAPHGVAMGLAEGAGTAAAGDVWAAGAGGRACTAAMESPQHLKMIFHCLQIPQLLSPSPPFG